MPVDVDLGPEAHALELDKELSARDGPQTEVLAVPHGGVAELVDGSAEGLGLVPGTWQRDALPRVVVVVGGLGPLGGAQPEQPSAVEIEFLPPGGAGAQAGRSQHEQQEQVFDVHVSVSLFTVNDAAQTRALPWPGLPVTAAFRARRCRVSCRRA